MPQIRDYSPQVSPTGPVTRNATAQDFGAFTGQALQSAGGAVAELSDAITKRAEQDDITEWYRKFSEKHAQETKNLEDLMANPDPNDPKLDNFAGGFLEKYNQRWDSDLESDAPKTQAGQAYVARQRAEMTKHFTELAMTTQAALKGKRASLNVTTGINTNANSLQSRPSDFELLRQKTHSAIDEIVKANGIGAVQGEQWKAEADSQLAQSAIYGWAKQDPAKARELLDSDYYKGMFNETTKHALYRDIHVQEEAERSKKLQAEHEAERAKNKRAEVAKSTLVDTLLKGDVVDIQKDIVGNKDMSAQDKLWAFQLVNTKKLDYTDPSTFSDVFSRIHQLDADHLEVPTDRELNQLFADHKITLKDLDFFRREKLANNTVEGRQVQQQIKTLFSNAKVAYGLSGKGGIVSDPDAGNKFTAFTNAFYTRKAQAEKEGIPLTELFNPANKSWYAGNLIDSFKEDPLTIMKKRVQSQTGGNYQAPPGVVVTDRGAQSAPVNPEDVPINGEVSVLEKAISSELARESTTFTQESYLGGGLKQQTLQLSGEEEAKIKERVTGEYKDYLDYLQFRKQQQDYKTKEREASRDLSNEGLMKWRRENPPPDSSKYGFFYARHLENLFGALDPSSQYYKRVDMKQQGKESIEEYNRRVGIR